MKPFTLEWWLVWKEYTYEMLGDFDTLTDEMIHKERKATKEEKDWAWNQYERYLHLHKWIRNRIITKYGEQNE